MRHAGRPAPTALYTPPAPGQGACRDCGTALPDDAGASRLYCERDRYRRRALTFAKAARLAAAQAGAIGIAGRLAECVRDLERAS